MPATFPSAAREFAVEVVARLRQAGFESLWAGGCVRDQLLGMQPKDYDVATNATPDQVRELFGRRRTIPVGASFGVITVIGRQEQGHIEVATFRRDAQYSDGRHPDSVTFSTAEQDALRRDFTINGLFFDPIAERVIDFVGGQEDLSRRLIRAIRDPAERIAEDKLRMLRGVRFAATFDFQLDPGTLAAIQRHADSIVVVSAERIAQELRRMLVDPRRERAVRLLAESHLLSFVLPEAERFFTHEDGTDLPDDRRWRKMLRMLGELREPSFPVALAALVRDILPADEALRAAVARICERWRLSNREAKTVAWLLEHEPLVRAATKEPWSRLQPILIQSAVGELLELARATAVVQAESDEGIEFCRYKLSLPREQLAPRPLVTGNDLKTAGLKPGPHFRELLERIRNAQLDGIVRTKQEAIDWAMRQ